MPAALRVRFPVRHPQRRVSVLATWAARSFAKTAESRRIRLSRVGTHQGRSASAYMASQASAGLWRGWACPWPLFGRVTRFGHMRHLRRALAASRAAAHDGHAGSLRRERRSHRRGTARARRPDHDPKRVRPVVTGSQQCAVGLVADSLAKARGAAEANGRADPRRKKIAMATKWPPRSKSK